MVGLDGNAFAILGRVSGRLPFEERDEFVTEATSSDYNHLLATVMDWVETA